MTRLVLASLSMLLITSTAATASAEPTQFYGGIGVGGVIGFAHGSHTDTGAFNPTLHLDLGARLTRGASLYVRGEVGTIILASQAAAYLVVGWTVTPRFSLATGIGADAMATFGGSSSTSGSMPATDNQWSGVSVPLLVGFRLFHSGLRLDLEGAIGVDAESTVGWHSALSVEWLF